MDDELDLRNFSNRCRLFPLPNVVLFPHAVLPLHIFEPRYRQMTWDALLGDKLVTVVQLRSPGSPTDVGKFAPGSLDTLGSPPIETVACIGKILQHERLPDGRFNYLLLGLKRVRLKREIKSDKLYRIAEAEVLEDIPDEQPEEPRRGELVRLFEKALERYGKLAPELSAILEGELPLSVLTDIISHALGMVLAAEVRQCLLANPDVGSRADTLVTILRGLPVEAGAGRDDKRFPPPFSAN